MSLIEKGVDLEYRLPDGYSPLDWAAVNDNVEAIELLYQCGVDINARDQQDSRTSFHHAASCYSTEALKFFIKKGGHLHAKSSGKSVLDFAKEEGEPFPDEIKSECIKLIQNAVTLTKGKFYIELKIVFLTCF